VQPFDDADRERATAGIAALSRADETNGD
jgi:hypothetical protein